MSDKVIVFDLGKVIFDYDVNIISNSLSEYSSEKILFNNMESFMISNIDLFVKYEKGLIFSIDFYNKMVDLLSLKNLSFEKFSDIWNEIFTPINDVIDLIFLLSDKYEISLLSNTNELHFDYLYNKYSNILNKFKNLHLSYKMKMRKPDKEIYENIIKFYNVKPENIFFTDDNQNNVNAAQKAGIKAFSFENSSKLKKDLKSFGIEI
ncbi:MAG: HAD family phosphatase [Elusimicrobia bacterium]|nr:HAD family phosphatase [Elusimicrobiota bacterium]